MSDRRRSYIGPRMVLNGLLLIAILVVGAIAAYAWRALPVLLSDLRGAECGWR